MFQRQESCVDRPSAEQLASWPTNENRLPELPGTGLAWSPELLQSFQKGESLHSHGAPPDSHLQPMFSSGSGSNKENSPACFSLFYHVRFHFAQKLQLDTYRQIQGASTWGATYHSEWTVCCSRARTPGLETELHSPGVGDAVVIVWWVLERAFLLVSRLQVTGLDFPCKITRFQQNVLYHCQSTTIVFSLHCFHVKENSLWPFE
jgi:hypothetical protein